MAENETPDPAAASRAAVPAPSTSGPPKTSPVASPPESPAPAASTASPVKPPATSAASAPAPPAKKPEPPKAEVQIYNRQKDQHVVGPGCWCFPKIEVVDGQRIIVHKRS